MEKKKNEFGNEVNQDWKLNKRVTLPEDCNLDTIDVVCDKKKTIGSVTYESHESCDITITESVLLTPFRYII